jgi:hypothetical protein
MREPVHYSYVLDVVDITGCTGTLRINAVDDVASTCTLLR